MNMFYHSLILLPALFLLTTWCGAASFQHFKYTECTSSSCPALPPLLKKGQELGDQVIVFETSPNGFAQRFETQFSKDHKKDWYFISFDEKTETDAPPIIGFGGAFTDSAAILYKNLSPQLKEKLISAYFSFSGNAYTLGRVPIASSDFSCRVEDPFSQAQPSLQNCSKEFSPYTYADQPDNDLRQFKLAAEDINYKIPFLKDALKKIKSENSTFKLFASPWSAPAWMKTNASMIHGSLLPYYQSLWATYFVRFLQEYQLRGIQFWAVTVQNEPEENSILGKPFQNWQTMFYTSQAEGLFVKNYLGPALSAFEKDYHSKINILIHDDQVSNINKKMRLLSDPVIAKYVAGAGLHWYKNNSFFTQNLDEAFQMMNSDHPSVSRFILGTEACEGFYPFAKGPSLGSWSRGEAYAHDILTDLNHHVSGWTDWNLLLDRQGGPNWAKNYVDAAVLVDLEKQVLYLQPMYYYLGHFSRYLRPGSQQLQSQSHGVFPLEETIFKVPSYQGLPETIVVIVLNRDHLGRNYYLQNLTKAKTPFLDMHIPAHAIQTIMFQAEK